MKKIGVLALGLAIGLGLMSCYLGVFKSGSISMDFSGLSGRAIQNGYVARVYLLADGLLFSTGGGTPFAAEVEVDQYLGAKVKIDGLPAGPVYKALVGFGPVTDGVFSPEYYGESPRFQITPGGDTATSVSMQYPPFSIIRYSTDLMSRNIKAVGNNFGNMIAAEDTRLYYTYFDGSNFSPIGVNEQYDLAADSLRANGLSTGDVGSWNTWLNTNNGIFPFTTDGWGFQTDFNSTLSGPRDILQSGTALVGGYYALFFRRTSGLGGSYIVGTNRNSPTLWTWVSVDVPGLTDMAMGGSNAFFAASGAGFALPPAFLTDPVMAKHRKNFSAPAPIQALGVRSGAPSMVYMGTTDGVWFASMDETNYEFAVDTPLDRILETAGEPIEKIAVSTWTSSSDNQAYLSRYWLFIKTGGSVYKIPFYAVFPGKPTGIAWDSSHNLYISGTEGLAAVSVGGS